MKPRACVYQRCTVMPPVQVHTRLTPGSLGTAASSSGSSSEDETAAEEPVRHSAFRCLLSRELVRLQVTCQKTAAGSCFRAEAAQAHGEPSSVQCARTDIGVLRVGGTRSGTSGMAAVQADPSNPNVSPGPRSRSRAGCRQRGARGTEPRSIRVWPRGLAS